MILLNRLQFKGQGEQVEPLQASATDYTPDKNFNKKWLKIRDLKLKK